MRDYSQHDVRKAFSWKEVVNQEVQFVYKLPSACVNVQCASSNFLGGLLFPFFSTIVASQGSTFFMNYFFLYVVNFIAM